MSVVMVVCEGHTEQAFVRQVLKPALAPKNIFVESINVGGGGYKGYRDNIQRTLRWKPPFDVVTSIRASPNGSASTTFARAVGTSASGSSRSSGA